MYKNSNCLSLEALHGMSVAKSRVSRASPRRPPGGRVTIPNRSDPTLFIYFVIIEDHHPTLYLVNSIHGL
jgi:hypothetical protein